MEIRRKRGSRVRVAPDEVYAELERIRDGGDLKLQDIVDKSKPKGAVLHKEFEWKDEVAANSWRLYEARQIVKSVEVVPEKTGQPVRQYEAVIVPASEDEPAASAFRTIEDVMADPCARDELLASAIRDVIALRRRYAGLQELSKVWAALDNFLLEAQA